jgi:tetratricopeptide (TPR) repeat protein
MRSTFLIAVLALAPALAHAQVRPRREPLKPGAIAAAPRSACSTAKPTGSPTEEQRQQARDLAQRGQQAAIVGDNQAALRALKDAAALDPTNADFAYQLARAYEGAQDAENAAKEYCRFLVLSPTAPEAGEVIEKVRLLAPPDPAIDSALTAFQSGVDAYDRGQLFVAEKAFSDAIAANPAWADAYYNRGEIRLARDNREGSRTDFELYLQLKPTADDRARVAAQIATLRRPIFAPEAALGLGVLVPGGGWFYTRQPVVGVVTLAGVGGAIAYAVQQKSTVIATQQTANDPFGNPYTFTTTRKKTEQPNAVGGGAIAGGLAGASAIASAIYANMSNTESRRVSLSLVPSGGGLLVGMSVRR